MADTKVSIGTTSRPDVALRTGRGGGVSVVARPIPVSTPGLSIAASPAAPETSQLVNALDLQTFSRINQQVLKESRDEAFKEGELARTKNQEDWAKAVESGTVSPTANPWFIKGYQAQDGRVAGLNYYGELQAEYAKSAAKGSDDPKVYDQFVAEFTKKYMTKVGDGRSADWMTGFQGQMESSQRALAAEHAQEAQKAVIATQEANTGAELNIILNSTRDPKAAADAINALGQRMKLMGMPSASFEKVAAEAILAKAKLGDTGMLKALDGVKTGDGKGTLSSNPKIVSARVETERWITEKRRGDVRWAWANDDRAWTLQQRQRAEESYKREEQRWTRQNAEWDREAKARSLMSQITTSTLSDPANAYTNNQDRLKQLAEIDARAAESSSGFIDGFLTKRERVPDAVERPVIAQLQRDMVLSAGNPAAQKQLLLDANRLFSEGKIGRETVARFIDDAQKFASWDPETMRKLQDPQVNRVRQAAAQVFMDGKSQSLYGSAALDALVAEQVIDRAVIDMLHAKPQATAAELAEAATKALQGVLPTLNPSVLGAGRAADLGAKVGEAGRNLQNRQPQDGNTPPSPQRLTPDQAAAAVDPVDAQAFIRSVEEALQSGGLPAMSKAIADFDAGIGVPGLGQKLIDLHAKPRESAPKKP